MKIWVKVMAEGKIVRQGVYENEERLTYSHFFEYLTGACELVDVPTPVLMKAHVMNFAKFNYVKFKQSDFIDFVDFDWLVLEYLR